MNEGPVLTSRLDKKRLKRERMRFSTLVIVYYPGRCEDKE